MFKQFDGYNGEPVIGAIDIGGTKISVGMLDWNGHILARREIPSGKNLKLSDGFSLLLSMLRDTAEETGEPLEGIGIGCTGPVDPFTGVLEDIAFLPDWRGFHLAEELRNAFDVPVFLENDADAAALGEYAWGAGKGSNHFIYITVSTGIGGGMVIDGQLYRGADGAHPEVGHIVIDPSGPRCFCGAHGCWESLASGPALAERAGLPTALAVCKAAENGDPAAQAAINLEAYYLGIGFANLITLFVPDVIAFGGGVMNSRHLFWDRTYQTIQENCGMVPFKKTRVVPAQLGKDVVLVGAAEVWKKRIYLS